MFRVEFSFTIGVPQKYEKNKKNPVDKRQSQSYTIEADRRQDMRDDPVSEFSSINFIWRGSSAG